MEIEIIDFNVKGDERGLLVALESNKNIPFEIKRVYYIYGTKPNVLRGKHAHKQLQQVAICLHGSCKMLLDDGKNKKIVTLNSPKKGLIVREMIWHEMYEFSKDCVLMILASEFYEEEDYIRNYKEFKALLK